MFITKTHINWQYLCLYRLQVLMIEAVQKHFTMKDENIATFQVRLEIPAISFDATWAKIPCHLFDTLCTSATASQPEQHVHNRGKMSYVIIILVPPRHIFLWSKWKQMLYKYSLISSVLYLFPQVISLSHLTLTCSFVIRKTIYTVLIKQLCWY